jgi:NAD(P)-dependent dehydrogenase (short-subunit alcohol dehydrogenase family)
MVAQVVDVNTTGVLFTAQAAGRQMARFGRGGSIILIASMSGSITNKVSRDCRLVSGTELVQDHAWVPYNTSKSAVLQMARSMACELGEQRIRVNTLSPGYIYTQ